MFSLDPFLPLAYNGSMASHDKLIRALTGSPSPLPLEQLAYYWAMKNVSAIAAIAMRSMMDPVGTVYDLPPLRIVGFQTGDARILYQLRLHDVAKAQRTKPIVQHAIGQHIEELALFCREQFIVALMGVTVTAIFQRDEFARHSDKVSM